jgi:hypothetical protein
MREKLKILHQDQALAGVWSGVDMGNILLMDRPFRSFKDDRKDERMVVNVKIEDC